MKRTAFLALAGLTISFAHAGVPSEVRLTTYLGGSGDDDGWTMASGPDGRIYVAGITNARDIPASNTHAFGPPGDDDIFVARLAPDHNSVESVTYIGGSGQDQPQDIAVDGNGGIVVTGLSASADFPTINAFQDTLRGGGLSSSDAVLFKLTAAGDGLVYSTYFGGLDFDGELLGNEFGRAIHIDDANNVWLTGETGAPDFPATQVFNGRPCLADENAVASIFVSDAWIARFDPDGQLQVATCLGGTGRDVGRDIIVDGAGDIYLNGHTRSFDFPVTSGAYQTSRTGIGSAYDAYVMKLDADLTTPYFSTYFGATSTEFSQRSVLLPDGSLVMSGSTFSPNFPATPGAPQATYGGGASDAMIFRISADGTQLLFATFLGGPLDEYGFGFEQDTLGRLYLLAGADLPLARRVVDAEPGLPGNRPVRGGGGGDAFVVTYTNFVPSFFAVLGGSFRETAGSRVVFDDRNLAWVSGGTESPDFPVVDGFQPALAGPSDAFLARFVLDADGDGIADDLDNCLLIANVFQRDTDADGYGNACDPDLDNSGLVNFSDLQLMQAAFFTSLGDPAFNPDADFNGDGVINFSDLLVMQTFFFRPPGPSAQAK